MKWIGRNHQEHSISNELMRLCAFILLFIRLFPLNLNFIECKYTEKTKINYISWKNQIDLRWQAFYVLLFFLLLRYIFLNFCFVLFIVHKTYAFVIKRYKYRVRALFTVQCNSCWEFKRKYGTKNIRKTITGIEWCCTF